MSLRNRTLLLILVATLLFVVLGALHSYYSFLEDYKDLEIADIKSSVIHSYDLLEYKIEENTAIANDWAAWDDTYQFIRDRNEEYLNTNLVDGTFENLGLDLIVYFDTKDQIVYEKAYDLLKGQEIPVSDEIHSYFKNKPDFFSVNEGDCSSGFLPYNDNLMLFSLCPILTSLDEGPSRGYLFFAKQTNDQFLRLVKSSRDAEINVFQYSDEIIPDNSTYYQISDPNQIDFYIHEISNKLIEYYFLIEDIDGNPIFTIRQVENRKIHAAGMANVRNQVFFMVFICIAAGGIFARMVDKYILSRISTLHKSVIAYRNNENLRDPVCLPGNDELSQLSFEIDNTLHSLLITQSKLNGYLQYGNLMVDISTRFINLPVSKIDQSLQNVLETVCKYINVDRGQILIFKEEGNSTEKIYEWHKDGINAINEVFLNLDKKQLRWAFKRLNIGNSIVISKINDLPNSAIIEKSILKKHNIQSAIGVPLMVAGNLIGLVSVQIVGQSRIWDEQTPILMEIISNIIANAIDRKRNEIELQNSKQFQYQLNQITKTSIEKDTYISSIRALSRQLCSLISSERCWLILHDMKQDYQVFESGKEIKLADNISKVIGFLVSKTAKNYFIHNSTSAPLKRKAINLNLIGKSFIALPLSAKKQHMGLIILANDKDHSFTTLERGICQQAAKQITLAIIKIRALEDSQELSKDLQELREAIVEFSSELDINKLRNSILSRAVDLLKAEGGEYYTYQEDTNELITVSSLNMNGDYTGTRLKIGQGAAGRAVKLKKNLFNS